MVSFRNQVFIFLFKKKKKYLYAFLCVMVYVGVVLQLLAALFSVSIMNYFYIEKFSISILCTYSTFSTHFYMYNTADCVDNNTKYVLNMKMRFN